MFILVFANRVTYLYWRAQYSINPVFINHTPYMFQACDREYSLITRHVDFTRAVTAREVFSLRSGLCNCFFCLCKGNLLTLLLVFYSSLIEYWPIVFLHLNVFNNFLFNRVLFCNSLFNIYKIKLVLRR